MSSFPLAWTRRSYPETQINAQIVPPKLDGEGRERLGALDRSGSEEIDRLIVGGFVDLRLDDGAVPLDPEVDDHAAEVFLRT
jgi:hypothetical protein